MVAGIGTDVGKTVVSAILCEALNADYWKPIQAGDLDCSDSHKVLGLLADNNDFQVWPEAFRLSHAMSPHAAAERDAADISLKTLLGSQPDPQGLDGRGLVIELAGGLMVPLSQSLSTVDLIKALAHPVVLVANYYLGSINHTLLSIHLLKSIATPILGIVFNGEPNIESRDVILAQGGVELLAEIPHAEHLNKKFIQAHAQAIRQHPAMARL